MLMVVGKKWRGFSPPSEADDLPSQVWDFVLCNEAEGMPIYGILQLHWRKYSLQIMLSGSIVHNVCGPSVEPRPM